jgi:hypothetical protein
VIRAQERAFGHGIGENGLMSHQDHPFNPQYQRIFDQLQPQLEERGVGIREAQNVAGALAVEAQRTGIVPDRIVANGDRVFAVQGTQPETQRYAQVDMQAAQTPLAESSRQSLNLLATQAQPAPEQEQAPQLRARL